MERINKNHVTLVGQVEKDFLFSHETHGKRMFEGIIAVERSSGYKDIIPVMIDGSNLDLEKDYTGETVKVVGKYLSYNLHTETTHNLKLFVAAKSVEVVPADTPYENHVVLEGYLCKEPIYRKTPLEREITDVMLAVDHAPGRAAYIPLIVWDEQAKRSADLKIGDCIKIHGRIQSREYVKTLNETETETRVAYEVSVYHVRRMNG